MVLLLATLGVASRDDGWEKSEGRERTWSKARADTRYIVVLKPNNGGLLGSIIGSILPETLDALAQFTLGAFSGFNAELTQDQLEKLKKNPNVRGAMREEGIVLIVLRSPMSKKTDCSKPGASSTRNQNFPNALL